MVIYVFFSLTKDRVLGVVFQQVIFVELLDRGDPGSILQLLHGRLPLLLEWADPLRLKGVQSLRSQPLEVPLLFNYVRADLLIGGNLDWGHWDFGMLCCDYCVDAGHLRCPKGIHDRVLDNHDHSVHLAVLHLLGCDMLLESKGWKSWPQWLRKLLQVTLHRDFCTLGTSWTSWSSPLAGCLWTSSSSSTLPWSTSPSKTTSWRW